MPRPIPGGFPRRRLLQGAAALGSASLVSGFGLRRLMAGAGPSGRRFVFVYVPGGWDQLLFLDPREFEYTVPADGYAKEVERTGIDTSYTRGSNDLTARFGAQLNRPSNAPAGFAFGPVAVDRTGGQVAKAPSLVSLYEQGVPMAIVRGMNMGTLGHEPGYAYMLTGEPAVGSSARGTSMPIRLAAGLGKAGQPVADAVVSVIAMGVQSFTGSESGRYAALQLGNADDIGRVLQRPAALTHASEVEAALAAYATQSLAEAVAPYDGQGLVAQLRAAEERTHGLLSSQLIERFTFATGQDAESKAIRARYGIPEGASALSTPVTAAFVAQTIKHGLAQFQSVVFGGGGDSHFGGNKDHAQGLHGALAALSALIDDLKNTPAPASLGGSWMDNTTIVLFSEFGRTPRFNPYGGRDHHFTNSCLLVGAGVQPGVVGASSETGGQQPLTFDFDQQAVRLEGPPTASLRQRHITPADIGATLLASAGLDYGIYRDGLPLWSALTAKPY